MYDKSLLISLDFRKPRIRIYKTVLQALNVPTHIQILVNPELKVLAIRGINNPTAKDRYCAHKVSPDLFGSENCCEVYSKLLIDKICSLVDGVCTDLTYNLVGKISDDRKIIYFPLNTLKVVEH